MTIVRPGNRIAAMAFVVSVGACLATSGLGLILGLPAIVEAARPAAILVALAAVAYLLTDPGVRTIARNTIAQAIRVRVAFVIMALYLLLVPALPFLVKGDGTLRGLLHVVVGYSLILAGLLLGLLSLALSTTTLWTELRDKQVFLLEAKPIRRWQVLLGKLLGILAINVALLAFMAVITWASVRYLVARAERETLAIPQANAQERRRAERRLRDAKEQVLAARRTVLPDPPPKSDLETFITRNLPFRVQQLERSDRMPPEALAVADPTARRQVLEAIARRQLAEEFANLVNAVPPLFTRVWRFSGLTIPRVHDLNLTVRFKFFSSDRKSEDPDHVRWEFGVPNRTKAYRYDDAFLPDEVHEIQVPADTIDKEGVLEVRFSNLEPRRPTLIFSERDSIQVLVPVAGFVANLIRGCALILLKVLFIAILGLFCSTFLSFPVSPIVAVSALAIPFLVASLRGDFEKGFTLDPSRDSPTARAAERLTKAVTSALHAVLPPLPDYSPSERVSAGEEVSLASLLEATWLLALVHGGLLMLLGMHIFERREIALATP